MVQWTGHALVDVGIAALCAMAGKQNPEDLTLADLDAAADEMERYYFGGALTSYLTCVFMNSEYVQPGAGTKKEQSRKRYAERVLRAHRAEPEPAAKGQACAFSGLPATHRIHRGQMPLLTGEGVLNFFPAAAGGLFVAGPYLTALQALPLGGRRSEGKLLIAHSDCPALTLALAERYVEDNRRLLALAMSGALPNKEGPDESLLREQGSWDPAKKRPKYPDAKSAPTLIASDLLDTLEHRRDVISQGVTASVQIYWLSSSGQGPSLEVFSVPSNLIRFLSNVVRAPTNSAWRRVVASGWDLDSRRELGDGQARGAKRSSKKGLPPNLAGAGRSRNAVLVDLFKIYADSFVDLSAARRFVRSHLLSELRGAVARPEGCDWRLTDLFLREVLTMNPERVERIREFADSLGAYIQKTNDVRLFRRITYAKYAWVLRGELVKAQRREFVDRGDLLFSLDDYLGVFEAEDSTGAANWSLVRDLICIRLVEQLHGSGWLTPEQLIDETADEEQEQAVKTGE
jgi:CRISPR-associated protein Cst1